MTLPTFSAIASFDLVDALRHERGIDVAAARKALAKGAHPNTIVLNTRVPKLDGYPFSALAAAAYSALKPPFHQGDRHNLMRDMIDHGADFQHASMLLFAAYTDLRDDHPTTARRMVMGLHSMITMMTPYVKTALQAQVFMPEEPFPEDRDSRTA